MKGIQGPSKCSLEILSLPESSGFAFLAFLLCLVSMEIVLHVLLLHSVVSDYQAGLPYLSEYSEATNRIGMHKAAVEYTSYV